jgi:hypothetical protein
MFEPFPGNSAWNLQIPVSDAHRDFTPAINDVRRELRISTRADYDIALCGAEHGTGLRAFIAHGCPEVFMAGA